MRPLLCQSLPLHLYRIPPCSLIVLPRYANVSTFSKVSPSKYDWVGVLRVVFENFYFSLGYVEAYCCRGCCYTFYLHLHLFLCVWDRSVKYLSKVFSYMVKVIRITIKVSTETFNVIFNSWQTLIDDLFCKFQKFTYVVTTKILMSSKDT
ncbi:unnamed protein product, partial [Schistosoma mattheei]|uniref:Uncharacterized protein n=1 Tax=Schistosoma mattheei TaxID=31246 RepID=A0AA85AQR6_9TREM